MTDKIDLPYRPCVGLMMLNAEGLVFTGRRIDTEAKAWQMPQGGIDPGEDPQSAALRELKEETGTNNVRILAQTSKPVLYDLPSELLGKVWGGRYRGQSMIWFALRFLGQDAEIDITGPHQEFSTWRWSPPAELPDHIVPFKRPVYEKVLREFSHLL